MPIGFVETPIEGLDRPLSLPGLTFEAALYGAITLVALLLRFWELGDMPLSPKETETAVAALGITQGMRSPGEAGALVEGATALILTLGGLTEATARAFPALVGGLIPLPLLWARQLIGRVPAVIAAALLALSPLLIDASRILSSGAVATTISLALVLAIFDYARHRRASRLYAAAVLLALALTSGAAAFSALVALALWGAASLSRDARRNPLPRDVDAALRSLAPANGHVPEAEIPPTDATADPREQVKTALTLFGVTLLLVATAALTNLNGVHQGLFAPLGAWLASFSLDPDTPLWRGPVTLIAYEPLALALGLVGAFMAWRRARSFEAFLALWLLLALAAGLPAAVESGGLLAAAVVPAGLLAATLIARLVGEIWPRRWVAYATAFGTMVWGAALILLGFGHASLPDPVGVRYGAPVLAPITGVPDSDDWALRLFVGLPLILTAAAVGYVWRALGEHARPAMALAAASCLALFSLHAGWNLAYEAVDNVAELPRQVQTSMDVRAIRADVHEVIQVLTINRKDRTVSVDAAFRTPLDWYLRDGIVQFQSTPSTTASVVVLPADEKSPGARYAGQRYRVTTRSNLGFDNLAELWRWLIYRENPDPARGSDVMVWVRSQTT